MKDNGFLSSSIKQFQYYKSLGEKAMNQVEKEKLFYQHHVESNSMASLVKHLWGNMLSRWINFLSSDGEKPWRKRDEEFENDLKTYDDIMCKWNEGWNCLLTTLNSLSDDDMDKIIYIRNEGHTVLEAINRQLCHYSYHVGQMIYLAKLLRGESWESLSIPRGKSSQFNQSKFSKEKTKKHFTEN